MNINKKINVFIVDDDKLFSLALKMEIDNAFTDMPIKIDLFETGEKCMEKFKLEKPDIVILDYYLNYKFSNAADGIAVLDWIKKEDPTIKVIILTGEDNLEIALKSFHHGASDYIVKTETQFRKINYSLLNLFKTIEAKSYANRYKNLAIAISLCFALLLGGVIAIQVFKN